MGAVMKLFFKILCLLILVSISNNLAYAAERQTALSEQQIWEWLNNLPQNQRGQAEATIVDAYPVLLDLHKKLHQKRRDLQAMRYNQDTKPESLAKMGEDLHYLRSQLNNQCKQLCDKLRQNYNFQYQLPDRYNCNGFIRLFK